MRGKVDTPEINSCAEILGKEKYKYMLIYIRGQRYVLVKRVEKLKVKIIREFLDNMIIWICNILLLGNVCVERRGVGGGGIVIISVYFLYFAVFCIVVLILTHLSASWF